MKVHHDFDYGTDIFDIDVSPDGQFLTGAVSDISGRQKLVRFRIEDLRKGSPLPAGDAAFETLYDFAYNSPGNFVHSPDGRFLYGSSYYTGASNLFRYNFETKKMDVISNAETGLFRPLPLADGSLIAFEYTSKGFIPARVPTLALEDVTAVKYFGQETLNKYPELRAWKLPPPASLNSPDLVTRAGLYKPIQNMQLISAYPIVQGYLNTAAVGMRAEFADRLRVVGVNLDASYSPDPNLPANQRAHVSFDAHLCNHVGCAYSDRMRGELIAAVDRGDNDDLTLQVFVQKYGPTVMAAPSKTGFNRVAWITPYLALALGLTLVIFIVRAWRARPLVLPAGAVVPVEGAELEHFREQARKDTEI